MSGARHAKGFSVASPNIIRSFFNDPNSARDTIEDGPQKAPRIGAARAFPQRKDLLTIRFTYLGTLLGKVPKAQSFISRSFGPVLWVSEGTTATRMGVLSSSRAGSPRKDMISGAKDLVSIFAAPVSLGSKGPWVKDGLPW